MVGRQARFTGLVLILLVVGGVQLNLGLPVEQEKTGQIWTNARSQDWEIRVMEAQ